MLVKLLGTGSLYSKSNCASILIDSHILVDIGPGTTKSLIREKHNLLEIDTILLTHLHTDHILDFAVFIANIEVLKPTKLISIYCPKEGGEKILNLLNLLYSNYYEKFIREYIQFIDIETNPVFCSHLYTIKALLMSHTGIKSYGFIINNKLGITGDSALCENVHEMCKKVDTIICDCSKIVGDIYHMGINDIQNLIEVHQNQQFVLTHYRDETREALYQLSSKRMITCEDGYTFEV